MFYWPGKKPISCLVIENQFYKQAFQCIKEYLLKMKENITLMFKYLSHAKKDWVGTMVTVCLRIKTEKENQVGITSKLKREQNR